MKLSVVIVNYNVKYFLEQCLLSVQKAVHKARAEKGWETEIWVVDNASVDGSVEMVKSKFPEVKVVANNDNVGFSKANNQAIRATEAEYVLLLNPDTLVEDDTFWKTVDYMDSHANCGGLGVRMLDGGGHFLPESKRGLPTPWVAFYKIFGLSALFPKSKRFGKYHLKYLPENEINEVDVLSGAFMLLRKSTLDKVGFLDEDFFMYGEDIDLSFRIQKGGFKNVYFPETTIIHYKGESTRKRSANYVFVFYKAMVIFARKHFSQGSAGMFSLLIHLAIYLRAFMSLVKRLAGNIWLPLLDFVLIYSGLWYQKEYWEHNHRFVDGGGYPDSYWLVYMPIYTFLWMLSVYLSGGYDRPVKLGRILKGIFFGTIVILTIYSLLPENMRTSRALIVLGAIWALLILPLSRMLFSAFGLQSFFQFQKKRMAIVGEGEERERVKSMYNLLHQEVEVVGFISPTETEGGMDELGKLSDIEELAQVFRLQELVFCGKNLRAMEIMEVMSRVQDRQMDYRIVPPESSFAIGSQSVNTIEDLLTIQLSNLNKQPHKRNKRLFDISAAAVVLLISPFFAFFTSFKGLWRNAALVIGGKKTWVGCNLGTGRITKSPHVIDLSAGLKIDAANISIKERLALQYAREYQVWADIRVVWKNYRQLGNA
jgi:GT2 family glycosyltransferase